MLPQAKWTAPIRLDQVLTLHIPESRARKFSSSILLFSLLSLPLYLGSF